MFGLLFKSQLLYLEVKLQVRYYEIPAYSGAKDVA